MNLVDCVKNHNLQKPNQIPKPILKWVGGKTQILNNVIAEFPTTIDNYHEIFVGGGSVLLALLSYVKAGIIKVSGDIYAYDLNEPLIYVYINIQKSHEHLWHEIQSLIDEFKSCGDGKVNRKPSNIDEAKDSPENYYYWIRSKYNNLSPNDKLKPNGSAMFIFLNKTCFRGVFRVGPNGFNVPYGHYSNPEIANKKHIDEIHDLIQGVIFECWDFRAPLNDIESDDFVYLDPPYAPEKSTSFTKYTKGGFTLLDHEELFALVHKLTDENKKILMSNADVAYIRENFAANYDIMAISCKRSINSKNPGARTMEVLIKNY